MDIHHHGQIWLVQYLVEKRNMINVCIYVHTYMCLCDLPKLKTCNVSENIKKQMVYFMDR